MANHVSNWSLLDFSNESSSVRMYNGAITAVSIAGFLTAFGGMRTALEGITLGTMKQEQWVGDLTVLSNTPPTNVFAQRELKWLVRYQGNTTQKIHNLEIPTADPTGRLTAGTDKADLTETNMAAWVTAFEAFARTPDSDTETVTVLDVTLVGRNL